MQGIRAEILFLFCLFLCVCERVNELKMSVETEEKVDLDKCLEVAVSVAKEAGEVIAKGFTDGEAQRTAGWKGTADLVTEVDRRVERLVFARLRAAFPEHALIGEETAGASEVVGEGPTWVVDPIDGTTNFVHGVPADVRGAGALCGRARERGGRAQPRARRAVHGGARGAGRT